MPSGSDAAKRIEPYLLKRVTVGPLDVNCYLLADRTSRDTVIIDPGGDADKIEARIKEFDMRPVAIVNTHGHYDHIGANAALKDRYHIPLSIHRAEREYLTNTLINGSALMGNECVSPAADMLLADGDTLQAGGLRLTVMHTPGHTPGCICLAVADLLFTGDTLFCGTVGRWDLPGGDEGTLLTSLNRFYAVAPDTRVLPGHGPECLMKNEFRHNPFLSRKP
jgi:glyoxylase-like metal-dependent hydrolase (beta-lactamase superfamily II)